MERRLHPQRRREQRRADDERAAKALNDLLEAVREEAEKSTDVNTRTQLTLALATFATTRR